MPLFDVSYMYKTTLVFIIILMLSGCSFSAGEDEIVARRYCAGCHQFPDASLLDKHTWQTSVLPEMGYRIGVRRYNRIRDPFDETDHHVDVPDNRLISDKDWQSILDYYNKNAPEKLASTHLHKLTALTQFKVKPYRLPLNSNALITLIHADTTHKKIYLGNRYSRLYAADFSFNLQDSLTLNSPPAHAYTSMQRSCLLLMGIMDPNDKALGKLIELDDQNNAKTLIDSLRRPVHFQFCDLNNDRVEDIIICSFGNKVGELAAFEKTKSGTFLKHLITKLPGSRRTETIDIDNDAQQDIVALICQGDEQIVYLKNKGNFKFERRLLLRFPPSYGVSYFEMHDFNNDGFLDILLANGDNADYSTILKPYHGIRIFYNDGQNNFTEQWFYPMHGATQAVARDFDNDGDLDIAAIAFFADFHNHPERSFLYFENTSTGFKAQYTLGALSGRWMVMETTDLDNDNDIDIILGSMPFPTSVPDALFKKWTLENNSLLILRNNNN